MIVGVIVAININNVYSNTIATGVIVDGIDLSNISYDKAYSELEKNAEKTINEIYITFTYGDKSWYYNASDIGATIDIRDSIERVALLARTGSFFTRVKAEQDLKQNNYVTSSNIFINIKQTKKLLSNIKSSVDVAVVDPIIEFDPSEYDYFKDVENSDIDMSRSIFNITKGNDGYIIDTESAINDLLAALRTNNVVTIPLTTIKVFPKYTTSELEACTTLVSHSSSEISSSQRKNGHRNLNIEKAINIIKGLVVKPGEIVSFNELVGERTHENGWYEWPGPLISAVDFSNMPPPGINQVVSTLHNAVFTSNLKVLEHNYHQYPAYYRDFGMGMDAIVDDEKHDFVFQNTTEYPVFFNAYLWYSDGEYKTPGYVDIDVYTMPQEGDMHIRSEYVIDETIPPEECLYIEDTENKYAYANWKIDESINKMIYIYIKPRDTKKVSVYKVWYKDCTEERLGVFTEGVEVKREFSHTVTYPGKQGIIYTKPIPNDSLS